MNVDFSVCVGVSQFSTCLNSNFNISKFLLSPAKQLSSSKNLCNIFLKVFFNKSLKFSWNVKIKIQYCIIRIWYHHSTPSGAIVVYSWGLGFNLIQTLFQAFFKVNSTTFPSKSMHTHIKVLSQSGQTPSSSLSVFFLSTPVNTTYGRIFGHQRVKFPPPHNWGTHLLHLVLILWLI